ncbi:MAG: DUF5606 domain-containing protein [Bacteroidales bacterium]|nr:DUF5606 domain-containing protein [Bacteroidales bacterium]
MDLNGILAITGKPGLYKLITQTKSGALVESLVDKRRMPAFSNERISSLKDITMFTEQDDIPLQKVFQAIYKLENGGECINHKSADAELKAYMEKVLPNYDKDRVHTSDMKKLFSWYNILNANKLIDLEEEKEEKSE